ncbi:MAG: dihydroneopterin aldolase [Deltaproteobacteria bacterium]|nr:dihydroneopterin aldolase [Deltaproteobacteria bacterium]
MTARPSDAIFIEGIEFEGAHGYTAAERKVTRRFRCHVVLERDLSTSSKSDRIQDTVDYRKICQLVVEIGTMRSFRLLEALAGAIADAIQAQQRDTGVTVTVVKLSPPCPGVPRSASVRVVRPPLE